MTEAQYQARLIRKLRIMFPDCIVQKVDTAPGWPDLLILWNDRWACLEVKAHSTAKTQPNQDHYVSRLNGMSFAAYIYPENEREVLDALQQAFESPRRARVS